MDGWNTTFLLGRPIFRGYVSFREGTLAILNNNSMAKSARSGSFVILLFSNHYNINKNNNQQQATIKGQLGVPLTKYPWYLLCSTLGFLGYVGIGVHP